MSISQCNNRVRFFDKNDWVYGLHLKKIETLTVPTENNIDINDAIEYYEIKKYFDADSKFSTWTDDNFESYKEKSKQLFSIGMKHFNQVSDDNISEIYCTIEHHYKKVFWEIFDKFKIFNKISESAFNKLIHDCQVPCNLILVHKYTVQHYGKILREYLLESPDGASIFIHVYQQDYNNFEKYYLPNELTDDDIVSCLNDYIDTINSLPNDLMVIENMNKKGKFAITDEIRIKAKRRRAAREAECFKNSKGIKRRFEITFNTDQKDICIESENDNILTRSFSQSFIDEHMSYVEIILNFKYLFNFVDDQNRSTLVSKRSSSIIDLFLTSTTSLYYPENFGFIYENMWAKVEMIGYYKYLMSKDIFVEDAISYFFKEHLPTEFEIPTIKFQTPTHNASYAEKCSTMLSAFEAILRQYNSFVKHGDIDYELISISNEPIKFEAVKSLISKKYVYGKGDDFNKITYLMFSDQCPLSYVEKIQKENSTLEKLLKNEKIYVNDYERYNFSHFEYLKQFDIISIDADGLISLKNMCRINVLKDLYLNDVISKNYKSADCVKEINNLLDIGMITEDNTLLSKPEMNYLNYLLNNSEYENGPKIRNAYMHGNLNVIDNESIHFNNYMIILSIMVLLALKISDDLYLRELQKKESPESSE